MFNLFLLFVKIDSFFLKIQRSQLHRQCLKQKIMKLNIIKNLINLHAGMFLIGYYSILNNEIIVNTFSGDIILPSKENQAKVTFMINIGVIHKENIDKTPIAKLYLIYLSSFSLYTCNLSKKYSSQAFTLINLIY